MQGGIIGQPSAVYRLVIFCYQAFFRCYGDVTTLSKKEQVDIDNSNVDLILIPNHVKHGAYGKIARHLHQFELVHPAPGIVVLVSSDASFLPHLNHLLRGGYEVIVIGALSTQVVGLSCHQSYCWEDITSKLPTRYYT